MMPVLTIADLLTLVRAHDAPPPVDAIMVAGALTESGGNTDAEGDNGHSFGLWQLHDQGLGSGMSPADRRDPDLACNRILPEYVAAYHQWLGQVSGDDLAAHTYLWAERPFQFNVPN